MGSEKRAGCKLSVNINKLATLRNSRGANNPDIVKGALDCIAFGAQGITVHPRPDERHVRRADCHALKAALKAHPEIEFNIEGYPDETYLALLKSVRPEQATLVPDPPDAVTSNAGWLPKTGEAVLRPAIARLRAAGCRVSVFVDPATIASSDYLLLKNLGADRVELYTEAYAQAYGSAKEDVTLAKYQAAARLALAAGLGVNAGHDLSLDNLKKFSQAIPELNEVSIGHALICDALYLGLKETIRRYRACLEGSLAI